MIRGRGYGDPMYRSKYSKVLYMEVSSEEVIRLIVPINPEH
jgi:hypothetical protein